MAERKLGMPKAFEIVLIVHAKDPNDVTDETIIDSLENWLDEMADNHDFSPALLRVKEIGVEHNFQDAKELKTPTEPEQVVTPISSTIVGSRWRRKDGTCTKAKILSAFISERCGIRTVGFRVEVTELDGSYPTVGQWDEQRFLDKWEPEIEPPLRPQASKAPIPPDMHVMAREVQSVAGIPADIPLALYSKWKKKSGYHYVATITDVREGIGILNGEPGMYVSFDVDIPGKSEITKHHLLKEIFLREYKPIINRQGEVNP